MPWVPFQFKKSRFPFLRSLTLTESRMMSYRATPIRGWWLVLLVGLRVFEPDEICNLMIYKYCRCRASRSSLH
jgi:hypothetical protein